MCKNRFSYIKRKTQLDTDPNLTVTEIYFSWKTNSVGYLSPYLVKLSFCPAVWHWEIFYSCSA